MAFKQKTWTDRVAEFINRRLLTKEDGSTELVTVARSEGTVSTEGDGFTAKNMNDLEQRIADEFTAQNDNFSNKFNELNNALDNIDSTYSITSVIADKLDYIKNGKERIFICNGCTLANVNSVDISDSIPASICRQIMQAQYNNGLVNSIVWYDKDAQTFAGNYRQTYGVASPTALSSSSIITGQIRWFVK